MVVFCCHPMELYYPRKYQSMWSRFWFCSLSRFFFAFVYSLCQMTEWADAYSSKTTLAVYVQCSSHSLLASSATFRTSSQQQQRNEWKNAAWQQRFFVNIVLSVQILFLHHEKYEREKNFCRASSAEWRMAMHGEHGINTNTRLKLAISSTWNGCLYLNMNVEQYVRGITLIYSRPPPSYSGSWPYYTRHKRSHANISHVIVHLSSLQIAFDGLISYVNFVSGFLLYACIFHICGGFFLVYFSLFPSLFLSLSLHFFANFTFFRICNFLWFAFALVICTGFCFLVFSVIFTCFCDLQVFFFLLQAESANDLSF